MYLINLYIFKVVNSYNYRHNVHYLTEIHTICIVVRPVILTRHKPV